jgi:hypothetical protein
MSPGILGTACWIRGSTPASTARLEPPYRISHGSGAIGGTPYLFAIVVSSQAAAAVGCSA